MDHLLQAAVRSLPLAAAAGLGLWRVKSASIRHAVWTLVTASMLMQLVLSPLLPELPLRILRPAELIAIAVTNEYVAVGTSIEPPRARLSWEQAVAAVYFCGLLFFAARLVLALLFARGLVRVSGRTAGRLRMQSNFRASDHREPDSAAVVMERLGCRKTAGRAGA